jgi:CheY-like chemotaxis protein
MPPKHRVILCVDDDPDDQLQMLETIRAIDPTIRVASALNGIEALTFLEQAKLRNEFPCLVIMDINMPQMDGKQAIVKIKKDKALEEIPIILFTTSSSPLDQAFGEKHNVVFMTKPINLKDFHSAVLKMLTYATPN